MNVILISPHFPKANQYFAKSLKEQGVNVLGLGQEPYEQLPDQLKESLTEYFRVENLEDLEEAKRAVAFLIFKHGPIDRLESFSEYWLEFDAQLREQFNIPGLKPNQLTKTKHKSAMKKVFKKAGVPVVEGRLVKSVTGLTNALRQLGFPVVLKPDVGVGAQETFKISNHEELETFQAQWDDQVPYFVEPYIENGQLCTFDGLVDANGTIVFQTSFYYTSPALELLRDKLDYATVVEKEIDPKLADYGKAIVKEMGMKERFFHIEFFRLPNHDYIALEYNNRPAGGYILDLYNYAYSCDLYTIYAQMLTGKLPETLNLHQEYGVGIARRNHINYQHHLDDIRQKYQTACKLIEQIPDLFAPSMGDIFIAITASTPAEVEEIISYVMESF